MTATGRPAAALTGRWRLTRVGVLGTTSLGLAVMAHSAGGGHLPQPGVLVVAAVLLGLVAVPLTARRRQTPGLIALIAVEQVLLHMTFTTAVVAGVKPGQLISGGPHHGTIDAISPAAAHHGAVLVPDWQMLVFHGLAVLATAWLLARGEAWLWRTADRVVRAAFVAPSGLASRRPRHVRVPAHRSAEVRLAYATAAPRGPPARC
jgi:hypothetical protein